MEQTPIEKAIAEFNRLKAESKSLKDVIYLDGVLAVLDSILPYEKTFHRNIAEKAIRAFSDYPTTETEVETYLNKNHPL